MMKAIAGISLAVSLVTIALAGDGETQTAVPLSPRSHAVIERVHPGMKKNLAARGLTFGAPVFMRIFKEERILEVWLGKKGSYELYQAYAICHYSGDLGPKLREGDNQAPEGFYRVIPARMNPNSQFHLSFDLGYPNAYDWANNRTGSALTVHGNCVSIGCYAMGDPAIEEIWALAEASVRSGSPSFDIHAFPFRFTPERLTRHAASPHLPFWQNLQEGYDRFEAKRTPPRIGVRNRHYVFE